MMILKKTPIVLASSLLIALASSAQDLPVDRATRRITFRDTLQTTLDEAKATKKIKRYLGTKYKDVQAIANKLHCKSIFSLHSKGPGGSVGKELAGNVTYDMALEIRKGSVLVTRTNFNFFGAVVSDQVNRTFGQKTKIDDSTLEKATINNQEVFEIMNDQIAALKKLLQ